MFIRYFIFTSPPSLSFAYKQFLTPITMEFPLILQQQLNWNFFLTKCEEWEGERRRQRQKEREIMIIIETLISCHFSLVHKKRAVIYRFSISSISTMLGDVWMMKGFLLATHADSWVFNWFFLPSFIAITAFFWWV